MRVIITGSRDWTPHHLASRVVTSLLEKHGTDLVIVHGAAPGVDATFAEACNDAGVTHEPHPARWDDIDKPGAVVRRRKDGKLYDAAAGPNRNQEMVDAGAGLCLAFHPTLGKSKGTKDCVQRAIKAGIPTWWTWNESHPPVKHSPGGFFDE